MEHGLLFIKIIIGDFIDDVPPEVQHGEREVSALLENYNNLPENAPKCQMTENYRRVRLAKKRYNMI